MSLGWLVAAVLGVLLWKVRKELRMLRARRAAEQAGEEGQEALGRALTTSFALATLRLQLRRMRESGQIEVREYEELAKGIDACWASEREGTPAEPDGELWWSSCETGWNILTARGLIPYRPPPWQAQELPLEPQAVPGSEAGAGEDLEESARRTAREAPFTETSGPALQAATQGKSRVDTLSAPSERGADEATEPEQPGPETPQEVPEPQRAAEAHAWRPTIPAPVEKALRAVSGWPRILVPFLAQNVGWFIGGFLFLAGSVFLVTYTTGFTKAIVVFASLFAYALFLAWAGYKILRVRPSLSTAGGVLLSTSLLLTPLTIAAATRLTMTAGSSPLRWALAAAAVLASLVVFSVTAQLVSGVVHRSLRGQYPRLFLAIAALQLAAPLIALWPDWQLLAVVHLVLLALLAYGLLRFAGDWLHSIFVDRKKVAYFAAGSLLYAVGVTLVHLTWGVDGVSLPRGYYAPYLMVVSGLLFYLDAALKAHVHRHTFLSRFTFFLYGLSIVAVLIAIDAPGARPITLGLGAALYGMVLAEYLTLIPLYLMLACLAGLYADSILAHFPRELHFLLAVPALFGLGAFNHWAVARGARETVPGVYGLRRVGLVTYRITLLLVVAVAVWSLLGSSPGLLAVTSGLVLTTALWWLLRAAPGPVLGQLQLAPEPVDLLDGPWMYAPVLALTVTFGFASPAAGMSWTTQFALALMLLGMLWVVLLISGRRALAKRSPGRSTAYANSVLLSVLAGTGLAALSAIDQLAIGGLPLAVVAIGAGLLLVLSLNLYVRWVFYAFLVWSATAAVGLKLAYFPQRGVGLTQMVGVALLWILLWWLERRPDGLSEIARRRARRDGPERLLWRLPCCSGHSETSQATEAVVADEAGPSAIVADADRASPRSPGSIHV